MTNAIIAFEKAQNIEYDRIVAAIRGALQHLDSQADVTEMTDSSGCRDTYRVEVTAPTISLGSVVEAVEKVDGVDDAEPLPVTLGAVRATLTSE